MPAISAVVTTAMVTFTIARPITSTVAAKTILTRRKPLYVPYREIRSAIEEDAADFLSERGMVMSHVPYTP